ncbi:MAG: hypothetical protein LBV52_00410, partial [Spirochaetaceae bacterium]|nr:hypothetical protein [Spirochaetaceae bacterium]
SDFLSIPYNDNSAYLFFDEQSFEAWKQKPDKTKCIILSKNGDLNEACANLFDALHKIDAGYSRIYAQSAPAHGLGFAINDRLYKASFKDSILS